MNWREFERKKFSLIEVLYQLYWLGRSEESREKRVRIGSRLPIRI